MDCPPGQNKVALLAERYVAVSGGSTVISRKKEYKMPIKITLETDMGITFQATYQVITRDEFISSKQALLR